MHAVNPRFQRARRDRGRLDAAAVVGAVCSTGSCLLGELLPEDAVKQPRDEYGGESFDGEAALSFLVLQWGYVHDTLDVRVGMAKL